MFLKSYHKRLEQDLTTWVGAQIISSAQAAEIRRRAQQDAGGIKLPAMLGMLGGLLIASSVFAFVAANWQLIPRVVKLVMILTAVVAALLLAARFERRGARLAADAASTVATLMFGAGVALVGQMYHLPADWPGGFLLVGIGALLAALLMRSDGALVVAMACGLVWLIGRQLMQADVAHGLFLGFLLPGIWLAWSREVALAHNAVVVTALVWLALAGGVIMGDVPFGTALAYWLGLAVIFVALGLWAMDRGGPPLLLACVPWGLLGFVVVMITQLSRILDRSAAEAGIATLPVVLAGLGAVLGVAMIALRAHDRRAGITMACALACALAVPLVFWSGAGGTLAGRALVGGLVLVSASLMVGAGAMGGMRRLTLAGSALFGISVLVLLYQTIGSLLDQSLFFLVGGAALIALGSLARRLLRLTQATERAP